MRSSTKMRSETSTVFQKALWIVSNIPYGAVGVRDSEWPARYNRGSCSSKHALLSEMLMSMGVEVEFMIGDVDLHAFGKSLKVKIHVPTDTLDYHNFLRIKISDRWVDIDASFGVSETHFGLDNNLDWDGVSDCRILFPVTRAWKAGDLLLDKTKYIERLSLKQRRNRDIFFRELSRHLRNTSKS